jgi:hypothetical protein
MTQIIAALTPEYVLVASDRQLTFTRGPRAGQIAHDDTCKLVSLCGKWGIAYTGLAELERSPTHEWIARRLAENGCVDSAHAAIIIAHHAGAALKGAAIPMEFLIAGWKCIAPRTIQPHFLLISNLYDGCGMQPRTTPRSDFLQFERLLTARDPYVGRVLGQPLRKDRGRALHRCLRSLLKHSIGPKTAMREFAKEIVFTSRSSNRYAVGEKILAFSIPMAAARRVYETGHNLVLATEPDLHNTAFCYFDPDYSQIRQYGPTITCGGKAITDVETENDPSRDYQSSSFRILHAPKREPRGPSETGGA